MRSKENELKSLQEHHTQRDNMYNLGRGVFEKPNSLKRQRVIKKEKKETHKKIQEYPRIGDKYQAVLPELGETSEDRGDTLIVIEEWPHFHEHDVR